MKILLFGHTGWIGTKLANLLANEQVILAKSRLDHYTDLIQEVNQIEPSHVLNCAGLTGRPNVDWCEDHKVEVLKANVIGAAVLADTCSRLDIHYTYIGTGCIFEYDDNHKMPSTERTDNLTKIEGFKEEDTPNFDGSFYSFGKIMTENITKYFPHTLILRIRMPLSDDLHPRNFITKITKYEKVVNIPNSMSVLYELLPVIPDMMSKKKVGVYNFTNPGVISHNEILTLYKKLIDPNFEWNNFTLEEQSEILKAPRSNNYLDSTKLVTEYPQIQEIHAAIKDLFVRMASAN